MKRTSINLCANARNIYLVLQSYDEKDLTGLPTREIAEKAGCSPRTVRKYLKSLVALGYIKASRYQQGECYSYQVLRRTHEPLTKLQRMDRLVRAA